MRARFHQGTRASPPLAWSPVWRRRCRRSPSVQSTLINLPPASPLPYFSAPGRSPPWQRWLAPVQGLLAECWWRGQSRTRAVFNEPGSQGQNKDRSGALDEHNDMLRGESAQTFALRRFKDLYVRGFTGLTRRVTQFTRHWGCVSWIRSKPKP